MKTKPAAPACPVGRHTPTPWTLETRPVASLYGGDKRVTITIKKGNGQNVALLSGGDMSDAAFIVRACNNFQTMYDALKAIDVSDLKSIARVKVQNAVLKVEEI